ncbi:Transcription factor IIIA [Dermatophagoides farinae]|uniref:Transcription factor IIIA n=1 Tax=Dermatophagoides farinae TaxID=6954 RepID=A0A922I8S0_DERFA|nr:zinc finger protein 528-like [Dermatophagoides farinae]KAH7640814.1 zinc finger domain-containing protein [Dermatophagoides farinae]KAH9526382.1 Transcription factor IIIA [Dermatophagoides farinae]
MDTIINTEDNPIDNTAVAATINNMDVEQMNSVTSSPNANEDVVNQEVKSIEINLNVIKTFFLNTISLYEYLVKNHCTTCNVVESEEFVALHKNLIDFENIFRIFEVSFDKTLLTTLVKKNIIRDQFNHLVQADETTDNTNVAAGVEIEHHSNVTSKYPCYVSSCSQFYSTEEGAKIHFIKNHCKKGDVFDEDERAKCSEHAIANLNELKQIGSDRYNCPVDDCNYGTSDRSNFKVHLQRHSNARKFSCICSKKFFTRDPFMIHFVRLHMKEVNWTLAQTDIQSLRKTIRRLTNRKYLKFSSNDEIPDSDSDLNGPIDSEKNELNNYITQAIQDSSKQSEPPSSNSGSNDNVLSFSMSVDDEIDEVASTVANTNEKNSADENPLNSFNASLNLKDNFFTDSVIFRSEGVEQDVLSKLPANEKLVRNMSLSTTKDKIIQKDIKQRQRKYKCPNKNCEQDFFTSKNLLVHLKASHDPSNPVLCTEPGCTARFKSTALLAQHQKRHQVQYTCTICSYRTHLAALMTRHNRQHAGEHLHHECPVCHEKFEYLGALRSHLTNVHNEKEPLRCKFEGCEKKFKTIIGLKKHCREFHYNMKAEISCEWPDCTAVFSNKSAMVNHMRIHTNERPYQCTWQDCGKWFRLKETLKRHIKLHQGFKPYVCPFDNCNWSFVTKKGLKTHIEKGHLKNPTEIPKQPSSSSPSSSPSKQKIDLITPKIEIDDEEELITAQQTIEQNDSSMTEGMEEMDTSNTNSVAVDDD